MVGLNLIRNGRLLLLANGLLIPVKAGLLLNRLSDDLTNGIFAGVRSAITSISPKENLSYESGDSGYYRLIG